MFFVLTMRDYTTISSEWSSVRCGIPEFRFAQYNGRTCWVKSTKKTHCWLYFHYVYIYIFRLYSHVCGVLNTVRLIPFQQIVVRHVHSPTCFGNVFHSTYHLRGFQWLGGWCGWMSIWYKSFYQCQNFTPQQQSCDWLNVQVINRLV